MSESRSPSSIVTLMNCVPLSANDSDTGRSRIFLPGTLCLAFLLTNFLHVLEAGPPSLSMADVVSGRAVIVDLAYPLNERTNFWPGERYAPFRLETIATLEKDGVLSKALSLPEHIGTHIDAPNHFEADQPDVSQIAPEELFGEGVVIDISGQSESNPDYGLTVMDIEEWEREHGRIPEGAIVLLRTGWSRFWNEPLRFQGRDLMGKFHFPAYTEESARFLVDQRKVKGLGIDTLSIDRGISTRFEVHHVVNGAGKYGLENVAHLDKLPSKGFYLIVAPMKIEAGTGGPTRLFALLPGSSSHGE